ncbi:lysosomal proton-coupled steroid conjugate and bile acid symporter SLC46A3-like [Oculina patagonica]
MAIIDFRKITVEPVLFFYMLCTFMSFPIVQQLAFKKICYEKYDAETCKNLTKSQEDLVHQKTSKWILHQSLAVMLPSIAASLILGSWSDRVGRKTVLILPSVGSVLLYINYMLNVAYFSLHVNFILIGVCISGFFGGFATTLLGVFSYISDITDKSQRTLRVAVLESMIFMGGTVGNLVGGVLVEHHGFMAAFGLCLGANVLVILYVSFILPESYFPAADQEGNWALVAVHNHLKSSFQVLTKQRPQHQRLNLLVILFGILFFILIIFGGFNDITALYSKHSPRNFSPSLIGYFFAEVLFLKGVGVVVGIPLMTKILKWSDITIAIIGAVISIGFYVFLGLASTKWMMFVGALIAVASGIPPPCLRSIVSKQVESSELGTTFALLASLEVLETLIASIIFNNIYSATVEWLPGFCYFLMSGLVVIPIVLLVWLYVLERRSNPYVAMDTVIQPPDMESSSNNDDGLAKPFSGSQYGSEASTA